MLRLPPKMQSVFQEKDYWEQILPPVSRWLCVWASLGLWRKLERPMKRPVRKARFAKLRNTSVYWNYHFEEALELFKLPRTLGQLEGKDVKASIGRFGPYIQLDKLFVSIPKEKDPYTITYDDAVILIKEKAEKDAARLIMNFETEGIQVLNGRYGPYIKKGKDNYKFLKIKRLSS